MELKDTISDFKGVLEGKYDDLPEMAFYMVSRAAALPHRTLCCATLHAAWLVVSWVCFVCVVFLVEHWHSGFNSSGNGCST